MRRSAQRRMKTKVFRNDRSRRSGPVGRTPWSAAGPLAGFLLRFTEADEGVGCGPGGPPYHSALTRFEAIFEGVECSDEFLAQRPAQQIARNPLHSRIGTVRANTM